MNNFMNKICRRSIAPIIAWGILRNYTCKQKFITGRKVRLVGTSDTGRTVNQSLAYIDNVYQTYRKYAGAQDSVNPWAGMKVLELGPGENFGVALRFIADGADRVVCADKYVIERNPLQESLIYRGLAEGMSNAQRRRLAGVLEFDGDVARLNLERITYVTGCPAETLDGALPWAPYDLLVSWAVMQYVKDAGTALRSFSRVLRRDQGVMLHKIDFRDDGMFSQFGHHPLTFMCLSECLYGLMTGNLLRPNRLCASGFEEQMKEFGFNTELLVSQLVGMDKEFSSFIPFAELPGRETDAADRIVRPLYGRLAEEYKGFSERQLAVCGAFLRASLGDLVTCDGKFIY